MNWINHNSTKISAGCAAIGLLLIASSFIPFNQTNTTLVWLYGGTEPFLIEGNHDLTANLLLNAGIPLYPQDAIIYNGIRIPHNFSLPKLDGNQLVYKPAVPVTITQDEGTWRFYSGAATLGEALWEQNIILSPQDELSLPLNSPLDQPIFADFMRGSPITIQVSGNEFRMSVTAQIVGDALAQAGFALQVLDYAVPDEHQPIPDDRMIQIVRVREEVITEDTIIPFNEERVSDPEMDVGEELVIQAGENGTQTTTVQVRFEDGQEVSRRVLSEWVSKAPVTQRTAYGGNVVTSTFDSSEGAVDYYLALDARISSYLDTGNPTASGVWPYYGTIAVPPEWYSILKGSNIFVPGYGVGTVLDVCPGCTGENWIDVFIPTDQYVAWNRNETIYFLSPAPEAFTGELP